MSEPNTTEADNLMELAMRQLAEHKVWLAAEILKVPADVGLAGAREMIAAQVDQIKLRMVTANGGRASVVWDYPDELGAFLRSEIAPKHLRDTLAGGHIVDPNQPTFTAKRAP